MPNVTIPSLNNLTAFKTIMKSENVDEIKSLLIDTVTRMKEGRWYWGYYLSSTCKTVKSDAESDLLKELHASNHMDEVGEALRNYKRKFSDVQHQIDMEEGNTAAFMKGIVPLIDQPSANLPESIHADIRSAMKEAGYQFDGKKICYGIAAAVLLACVRQGGQPYMKRMQYLAQMDTLPRDIMDTHQVYAFFDTVATGMNDFLALRDKGYSDEQEQEVSLAGFQMPVIKHAFSAECTPETFIKFLQQMWRDNNGKPFGVMIHYTGNVHYVASAGFDGSKWLAANSGNHYYTENAEQLLHTFFAEHSDLYINGKMIAVMEIATGNKHSFTINKDGLAFNTESTYASKMLHLALLRGVADVITGCVTAIGKQAGSKELLEERLNCKDSRGVPGFFMALQNGDVDVITRFIRATAALIIKLPLSEQEKAELLCYLFASKRANGTPGFFMTLQCGHTEAITAFIKEIAAVIATFSLSEETKADLLFRLAACQKTDGMPGFSILLQHGHTKATTAFIQGIAAAVDSLDLPKEEKTRLLFEFFQRIKSDRKAGFLLAIEQGGLAVIRAFNEAIDQLPFSPVEKEALKHLEKYSME